MINVSALLRTITDADEKIIYAKAFDKYSLTQKTGKDSFSVFMDPFKAHRLKAMLNGSEVECVLYGGYEDAERLKAGFFAYGADLAAFPIVPVCVKYNEKFSRQLTHRDFLGSVLGLGITREKIGDIIILDSGAVCYMDEDIADYVCVNLERVGHTKVRVSVLESYKPKPFEKQEKRLTVASLRLDAVLSGAFNISRGKTSELIRGEKAFINWQCCNSGAKQLEEGDSITLRGFGRIKLKEIVGQTKKDRILINIEINK